jgi:hypothetical protein
MSTPPKREPRSPTPPPGSKNLSLVKRYEHLYNYKCPDHPNTPCDCKKQPLCPDHPNTQCPYDCKRRLSCPDHPNTPCPSDCKKQPLCPDHPNTQCDCKKQPSSASSAQKYLKYKSKYLKLKKFLTEYK